ncbi:DNA polymerase III subunit gamma/tau, partial [Acinetobacter baumannii]
TDPQKLPITVLSRCLQFQLKALTPEQIAPYLAKILTTENISFETSALNLLSQAAKGSVRDSLSLTDQAIASGNGQIQTERVTDMLG